MGFPLLLTVPTRQVAQVFKGTSKNFKDFDMEDLKLDCTVDGGANRVEPGELVIYSWDSAAEPAGLF